MPAASSTLLPRRRLLAAAAVGAGAAVVPLPSLTAFASGGPARTTVSAALLPGVYSRTRVPGEATRHLLSRFSFGVTPGLARDARRAGGASSWFTQQLDPAAINDSFAGDLRSWWPRLSWTPQQIGESNKAGENLGWDVMADLKRWSLVHRVYSRRQLLEVMTDFWSNHFNITTPEAKSLEQRLSYDAMIRSNALGRFDALLTSVITHPAMLCYLDASRSTKRSPNENLGRELLELHTVGQDSLFTEIDVAASTNILTGWRVQASPTWAGYYSPDDHFVGPVSVMDFTGANYSPDGRQLTRDYLHYLAHHPATANRIARKLAVRFVSDTPSTGLVNDLAATFTASGTDIAATLQALTVHPEFVASVGAKVRTPSEDVVATFRAMQVGILSPTGTESDAAHAILNLAMFIGQTPFSWPRPDGFPDANNAWASASRMLGSWRVHANVAGGWYPSTRVEYRTHAQWLPPLPLRFDLVVDHLCRRILARRSSAALLSTACKAVDLLPSDLITADHKLVTHRMPELLLALLDPRAHEPVTGQ